MSSYEETFNKGLRTAKLMKFYTILTIVILLMLIPGLLYGCPTYNVWQKGLDGEAVLKQAESSRKVAIEEAKAKLESAKHLADAEIERARGVAEANRIIGTSLKDNEQYLRWLYISGLFEHEHSQIIYIPTEATLPILEAGRLENK